MKANTCLRACKHLQSMYYICHAFHMGSCGFLNGPSCRLYSPNRFVGYPGHYGTLFGMRNEDVSSVH